MRKRTEKGTNWPPEQRLALLILGGAFLLGGAAGCLFAALAGGAGAQELADYLADYLSLAADGEVPGGLYSLLVQQVKYLLVVFLLGFTALGALGLPAVFGVRGFFFTFSTACFCRVFGPGGMLPAFVLFGLPALLWAPGMFLLGVQSLGLSRGLLRRTPGEGGRSGICFGGGQWCLVGLSVGLSIAAALAAAWVAPVLLPAAARIVL